MSFSRMCDDVMPLAYDRYTDKTHDLQKKLEGINPFDKYDIFFGDNSFRRFFIEGGEFPVSIIDPRGNPRDSHRITISSHREFYDISVQGWKDAKQWFGI